MRLISNISQMTSKFGKNKVAHKAIAECVTYATGWRFLYQFDAVSETPYSCDKVGRGL